jgi:hypothetical protein
MSPKITLAIVHSVWFPAVGALGDMRAWSALGGRGNGGVCLGVTIATSCEDTVVILAVWAQAYRTPELGGTTRRRGVAPSPASRAQRGARIGSGCHEIRGILPKLDSLPDEALGPGPRHRVCDVEVDGTSVGLGGVLNHSHWGLEDDEASEPRLPDLRHDPLRGDARVSHSEEWYVDQLQIRCQHGQCRIDMVCVGVAQSGCSPDLQQVTVGGNSRRGDGVPIAGNNR